MKAILFLVAASILITSQAHATGPELKGHGCVPGIQCASDGGPAMGGGGGGASEYLGSVPFGEGGRTDFYTDSQGATQLDLFIGATGEIVSNARALNKMPLHTTGVIRVVTPQATSALIPKQCEALASSASVVVLLQPSLGSADAAVSKSRFWDIAGPVAIARALNYPKRNQQQNNFVFRYFC